METDLNDDEFAKTFADEGNNIRVVAHANELASDVTTVSPETTAMRIEVVSPILQVKSQPGDESLESRTSLGVIVKKDALYDELFELGGSITRGYNLQVDTMSTKRSGRIGKVRVETLPGVSRSGTYFSEYSDKFRLGLSPREITIGQEQLEGLLANQDGINFGALDYRYHDRVFGLVAGGMRTLAILSEIRKHRPTWEVAQKLRATKMLIPKEPHTYVSKKFKASAQGLSIVGAQLTPEYIVEENACGILFYLNYDIVRPLPRKIPTLILKVGRQILLALEHEPVSNIARFSMQDVTDPRYESWCKHQMTEYFNNRVWIAHNEEFDNRTIRAYEGGKADGNSS